LIPAQTPETSELRLGLPFYKALAGAGSLFAAPVFSLERTGPIRVPVSSTETPLESSKVEPNGIALGSNDRKQP